MNISNKHISKTAGVLILSGILIGLLSIAPSVEQETFLQDVYLNRQQVFYASTFQFFLIPIHIGFALILYPILKSYHKTIAVGFTGFRFMAATFQLLGVILLPLFILLSEQYLTTTSSDLSVYTSVGDLLKRLRDLTNHVGVILPTGLGNLLLYVILFKTQLIPKWISIWGFFGNISIVFAGFLLLFQVIEVISPAYGIFSLPIVLQEITLAIWLLTKGLNTKRV